jgi:hypothetical protein
MPTDTSTALEMQLRGLQDFVRRGAALAGSLVDATRYREDDHFAFMAVVFLSAQRGHAEALLLLDEHCDTQLIARSMVEGMCQLFWAYHDRPARALRWRQFSVVVDWRLMREMEADGRAIPESTRSLIEARVARDGEQFLKSPANGTKARKGSVASDPYVRDWTGLISIRTIFQEVEADLLYVKPYRAFAAWHHWSPEGLGRRIKKRGDVSVLALRDPKVAASAVALGFQCVVETARLLDLHLSLGFGDQLRALRDEYTEWHRENQSRRTGR